MEIVDKVIELYPVNGFNRTKKLLKIGDKKLRNIILENKLEKNGKVEINFHNKMFVYTLGLIWADGSLSLKSNTIYIECIESDMINFKKVLCDVSTWSFYKRKREYKPTINAYITDKKFYKILVENDYLNKSNLSPHKIYSKIPNNIKKYFLLGLIDGDGCFYYNKKNYNRQFIITGSINQDWSLFENIFKELDIKYTIIRRINKKSGYSQIRVTNKKDIVKIGDFIYDDMIILNRKYELYKLCIS